MLCFLNNSELSGSYCFTFRFFHNFKFWYVYNRVNECQKRRGMLRNSALIHSKQPVDFDICKRNLLLKLSHELDKSKKGSVDEPIVSLVDYLNQTKDYCTTSSCSGRFSIFCASYDEEKAEQISVIYFEWR